MWVCDTKVHQYYLCKFFYQCVDPKQTLNCLNEKHSLFLLMNFLSSTFLSKFTFIFRVSKGKYIQNIYILWKMVLHGYDKNNIFVYLTLNFESLKLGK